MLRIVAFDRDRGAGLPPDRRLELHRYHRLTLSVSHRELVRSGGREELLGPDYRDQGARIDVALKQAQVPIPYCEWQCLGPTERDRPEVEYFPHHQLGPHALADHRNGR